MRLLILRTHLAAMLIATALGSAALAQEPAPPTDEAPAADAPASAAAPADEASPGPATAARPRRLAPGVLTVIPPDKDEGETFSGPRPIVEVTQGVDPAVLNWTPNYSPSSQTLKELASQAIFRRRVWHLEFAFKPMRMIYVDIPEITGRDGDAITGRMVKKPVWYMVYRIKNNGYHLNPTKGRFEIVGTGEKKDAKWLAEADAFGHEMFGVDRVNSTARFFPRFELVAHEQGKRYFDQLIPIAIPAIEKREKLKLHDSVSISEIDIPVSDERIDRSVWGVITFTDLDPEIDFFSLYIQGLTNAQIFEDVEGAFKVGSPPLTGRRFAHKTLQLNFWRPGDAVLEHEGEFHYGMPVEGTRFEDRDGLAAKNFLELYGVPEQMDYRWVYR